MTDKNWPDLIATAPVVPFEGRLVRCIPQLTYQKGDPPSYLFTSGMVNRCNPEGVSCIYMGEDRDTADCEYRSYYEDPEPQLTFFADFKARSIIDLGDDATREHFGFTDADFFTGYRLQHGGFPRRDRSSGCRENSRPQGGHAGRMAVTPQRFLFDRRNTSCAPSIDPALTGLVVAVLPATGGFLPSTKAEIRWARRF